MALDPDFLDKLREALKDPGTRSLIREEINNQTTTDLSSPWGMMGAVGKAMQQAKGSSVESPWAAGLGAGIGLLLRRRRQGQKTGGGDGGGGGGGGGISTTSEPNLQQPAGGGSAVSNAPAMDTSGATAVEVRKPWESATYRPQGTASAAQQQNLSPQAPTAPAPPVPASQPNVSPPSITGGSLVMGHGQFGENVFSNDGGKTWTNENTGAPFAGQVFDQNVVGPGMRRGGRVRRFVRGGEAGSLSDRALIGELTDPSGDYESGTIRSEIRDRLGAGSGLGAWLGEHGEPAARGVPPATTTAMTTRNPKLWRSLLEAGTGKSKKESEDSELAMGGPAPAPKRAVLVRRPMAVPVISTTIVISKKKPQKKQAPQKKKTGGKVKGAPPKQGPGNGTKVFSSSTYTATPPAPYAKGGRVQVPRGSGAARRGKHFRGIF